MLDEKMNDSSMQVVIQISNEIMEGPIYKIITLPKVSFDDKISIVTTTLSSTLGTFLKECIALNKIKESDIVGILSDFTNCTIDGINQMRSDDFTRKIMGDQKIII
jgi:hypothetical protein